MPDAPEKRMRRSRLLVPAAENLSGLERDATWILVALRRLLRRSQRPLDTAWEWIHLFDQLLESVRRINEAKDHPPAMVCPLVPVRMPVEVAGWPEPNEPIPVEYEDRDLGAIDNRRLVGRVAEVLLNNIALYRSAAANAVHEGQRQGSDAPLMTADQYALKAQSLARCALRGVDLDALAQAVAAEAESSRTGSGALNTEGEARTEVVFPSDKLAIVSNGRTRSEIRGERQVWVFRRVVEAAGRDVAWSDLREADITRAGELLLARGFDAPTPRSATEIESFRRMGRRIRNALGKLGHHWLQNGQSARWDSQA